MGSSQPHDYPQDNDIIDQYLSLDAYYEEDASNLARAPAFQLSSALDPISAFQSPGQREQTSTSNEASQNLQEIDLDLEEIELRLRRNQLLKRRQELLRDRQSDLAGDQHLQVVDDQNTSASSYTTDFADGSGESLHHAGQRFGQPSSSLSPNHALANNPVWFNGTPSNSMPTDLIDPAFLTGQFNMISEHHMDFDLGNSPRNTIDTPASEGTTDRIGIQQSSAVTKLSTTRISASVELAYRPSPCSTPSTSTTDLHHPYQRLQNRGIDKAIRHRSRSSKPNQQQRLSAICRQLSKKSGVPEVSLGLLCFDTGSTHQRKRTIPQKRNMRDVKNAGGCCVLCFIYKKKCSGQRPCDMCRKYWEKRVYDSTSFMWTCDVKTKLTDFRISNLPPNSETTTPEFWASLQAGKFEEVLRSTLGKQFSCTLADQVICMLDLMHFIEPLRPRNTTCQAPEFNGTLLFTYFHSILRWKQALLYLQPELLRALELVERLCGALIWHVFDACENAHTLRSKYSAVTLLVLLLDEIKYFKEAQQLEFFPETLKPSMLDDLELALQGRLKVFCSRIFDRDSAPKLSERDIALIHHLQLIGEQCLWLPSEYHTPPRQYFQDLRDKPWHQAPQYLSLQHELGDYCADAGRDICRCSWFFNHIPFPLLEFFGHTIESLQHHFHHNDQRPFAAVEAPISARKCLQMMFQSSNNPKSGFKKRLLAFLDALELAIWEAFYTVTYLSGKHFREFALTEEELSIHSHRYRQMVLVLVVEATVCVIYEYFT